MQTFTLDQKVTNDRGAWVILRNDANGGQNYSGVYFAEVFAADFPEDIKSAELTSNKDRKRVERAMRQWLASR